MLNLYTTMYKNHPSLKVIVAYHHLVVAGVSVASPPSSNHSNKSLFDVLYHLANVKAIAAELAIVVIAVVTLTAPAAVISIEVPVKNQDNKEDTV